MIKKLTYKGESFYPLTSTKSCINENGDSIDTLYKNLNDVLNPCIWSLKCINDIFVSESDPEDRWFKSLRNGISFSKDNHDYVLYPVSIKSVDGIKYWEFNFNNKVITINSNKEIAQ